MQLSFWMFVYFVGKLRSDKQQGVLWHFLQNAFFTNYKLNAICSILFFFPQLRRVYVTIIREGNGPFCIINLFSPGKRNFPLYIFILSLHLTFRNKTNNVLSLFFFSFRSREFKSALEARAIRLLRPHSTGRSDAERASTPDFPHGKQDGGEGIFPHPRPPMGGPDRLGCGPTAVGDQALSLWHTAHDFAEFFFWQTHKPNHEFTCVSAVANRLSLTHPHPRPNVKIAALQNSTVLKRWFFSGNGRAVSKQFRIPETMFAKFESLRIFCSAQSLEWTSLCVFVWRHCKNQYYLKDIIYLWT